MIKSAFFYTQGDYGLFQCSKPCCQKTFDNEALIREMTKRQRDLKIPTELIPKCSVCGSPAAVNLRCDDKFVQDEGWYAAERYGDFIVAMRDRTFCFWSSASGSILPQ